MMFQSLGLFYSLFPWRAFWLFTAEFNGITREFDVIVLVFHDTPVLHQFRCASDIRPIEE